VPPEALKKSRRGMILLGMGLPPSLLLTPGLRFRKQQLENRQLKIQIRCLLVRNSRAYAMELGFPASKSVSFRLSSFDRYAFR
jgi:hypothetical protein